MGKSVKNIRIAEFQIELVGSFIAFVIGTFITEAVSSKEFFDNIFKSASVGLIWAALAFLIAQQYKSYKKIRETLEHRMNQIIEFFALGTENGHFEHHLLKLKEHNLGSLRWAVAKFISHKLNKAFNGVSIIEIDKVDTKEYSKLLSELIKECSESIYMTCPYTPSEWFIELKINTDKCSSTSCPNSLCTYIPEEKELPDHIKAFCASKVPDKKRVVNIPQTKFQLLKQSDKCLINFLNYKRNDKVMNLEKDDNIKVKFIKQEDLGSTIGELKDDDYNILDSKIVMKWDPNRDDGIDDIGKCILIFNNAEVKRHMKIFENIETASYKHYDHLPQ